MTHHDAVEKAFKRGVVLLAVLTMFVGVYMLTWWGDDEKKDVRQLADGPSSQSALERDIEEYLLPVDPVRSFELRRRLAADPQSAKIVSRIVLTSCDNVIQAAKAAGTDRESLRQVGASDDGWSIEKGADLLGLIKDHKYVDEAYIEKIRQKALGLSDLPYHQTSLIRLMAQYPSKRVVGSIFEMGKHALAVEPRKSIVIWTAMNVATQILQSSASEYRQEARTYLEKVVEAEPRRPTEVEAVRQMKEIAERALNPVQNPAPKTEK